MDRAIMYIQGHTVRYPGSEEVKGGGREGFIGGGAAEVADAHATDAHAGVGRVSWRLRDEKGGAGRGVRHAHRQTTP